jgi:hypothetical protein
MIMNSHVSQNTTFELCTGQQLELDWITFIDYVSRRFPESKVYGNKLGDRIKY